MEDNTKEFIYWLGTFGTYLRDEYGIDLQNHPEAFTKETSDWLVQAFRCGKDPQELVELMIEDVRTRLRYR